MNFWICPNCETENELTAGVSSAVCRCCGEPLSASKLAKAQADREAKLTAWETRLARREAEINRKLDELEKAREKNRLDDADQKAEIKKQLDELEKARKKRELEEARIAREKRELEEARMISAKKSNITLILAVIIAAIAVVFAFAALHYQQAYDELKVSEQNNLVSGLDILRKEYGYGFSREWADDEWPSDETMVTITGYEAGFYTVGFTNDQNSDSFENPGHCL